MSGDDREQRRHSRALIPALIADEQERAKAEARNGLLQYDEAMATVLSALDRAKDGHRWRLRPSLILGLQRRALQDISSFAGTYRPGPVEIEQSTHTPPDAFRVPELVEDLCDYVNDHWQQKTAIHLAAYILWRLNWIHPFDDGNGRTSRIVSYVALLIKSESTLGGSPTIPALIVNHRRDYFAALDRADEALRQHDHVDVGGMEALLSSLLAKQLTSIYRAAGGALKENLPPDKP